MIVSQTKPSPTNKPNMRTSFPIYNNMDGDILPPLILMDDIWGGIIHNSFIIKLEDLEIPKHRIQCLMEILSLTAFKYLTYIIFNKCKLKNNLTPTPFRLAHNPP